MRIHLVQHSHTDIGYTALQECVSRQYAWFLKRALDLIDGDSEFRWTVETTWQLEQLARHDPAQLARVRRAVQAGRLEITGTYLHLTDLATPALFRRALARSRRLAESVGASPRLLVHNDINGFPWCLPGQMLCAGYDTLVLGMNDDSAILPFPRHSVFHWEGADAKRVLVYFGDHYLTANYLNLSRRNMLGVTAEEYATLDAEPPEALFEASIQRVQGLMQRLHDYPYDCVLIQASGFLTDNSPPDDAMFRVLRLWEQRRPVPGVELVASSFHAFIDALRPQLRDDTPVYRGAWPDYWSHGLGAEPLATARLRQSLIKLDRLERIDGLEPRLAHAIDHALLAVEHTAGSHESIHNWAGSPSQAQAAYKRYHLHAAAALLDEVEQTELRRRAGDRRKGVASVMNLDDAARDDRALIEFHSTLWDWFGVDRRWPYRVMPDGSRQPLQPLGGRQWVMALDRALARGERLEAEIVVDAPPPVEPVISQQVAKLENEHFALVWRIDGASLLSLTDKAASRQWVGNASRGFARWIHEERPAENRHRLANTDRRASDDLARQTAAAQRIDQVAARQGGAITLWRGPVFDAMEIPLTCPGCRALSLTIRLYHRRPWVEFDFTAHREDVNLPCADHVMFDFTGADDARLRLHQSGGAFEPLDEQVPGTCLDFYAVDRGACLEHDAGSLIWYPMDSPLVHVGEAGFFSFQRGPVTRRHQLTSNVANNYWHTNFARSSSGPARARYWLIGWAGVPGRGDWDQQTSLAALPVPSTAWFGD